MIEEVTYNKKYKAKDYFNIAQYRSDSWNNLKLVANHFSKNNFELSAPDTFTERIASSFVALKTIEHYFAYPGVKYIESLEEMYKKGQYAAFTHSISEVVRSLISESYRTNRGATETDEKRKKMLGDAKLLKPKKQNYFEVIVVDDLSDGEREKVRSKFEQLKADNDQFTYDVIFFSNLEDALIALLFNPNIQTAIIRSGINKKSPLDLTSIQSFIVGLEGIKLEETDNLDLGLNLGKIIKLLRPEIDLFYISDISVSQLSDSTLDCFNRVFYRTEDLQEIHLSVLHAVKERYKTPFFSALVDYSKKPTGVFHAMPISRGNSIFRSSWLEDFGNFYGKNIFLAETSATTGGLDSLLQPTGPLKKAQELASKAYGSLNTFFVTNGTSTANKIVLQALVRPEDLVLIDRDCHKSHHYGMVLSGSLPVYLDSYPVEEYSMYGAVPLSEIKHRLLKLQNAGRLSNVKMLLLTNCTFDGIVYNVQKVMHEILAIKPDMIFLWDEAWFAFAGFTPIYKQRTAMYSARMLQKRYKSEAYRKEFEENKKSENPVPMPDPDLVKIRVYATQSTHKTLSSLRQGSMIHIYDELFKRKVEDSFHEAYKTHTSTSPSYQILASLDAGRRQVMFEGYEMVEKSIEMAMVLRSKIVTHPRLKKYFDVLTVENNIPEEYRTSGIFEYYNAKDGWTRMEEAWANDEFVLDPTKINLYIGRTGVDGDTFKNKFLMDQFGIQINKTSRNSVLFMTNIGTTRSSVAYLISVLLKIANQLDEEREAMSEVQLKIVNKNIKSLTEDLPPLPDFSHFHSSFQAVPGVPGGNIREAYFLSYDETKCEFIKREDCREALESGREIVSASFVIPYPPGFPILVPGQVLSNEILEFFINLDVKEIHGYRDELGLRIFTKKALNRKKTATAMMGAGAMNRTATKFN
ncbi:aminotransferase class I/II-fold pyridoxal phosphate-dependent enzyme [Pedobacter endophyticus]|uniref:Ornithine decarboxylase n=1 Tax=Pedobacter endophyticus TaxID=2789740 RepID=A0A7S9PZG4_9SPHI|nr:ornithine decarboxylase [Pedobacter endophyticus]QPH39696.1 ornithine decarboxylase [Pedobacter endophyticus]